jgi:hypothetical protein
MKLRINSAYVLALVAIVLALGGNAVAFTLGQNSVGARQLKKGAVNSAKVKDRSLRAVDFKKGQLPAGPRGSQGSEGPKGARGEPGPAGLPGASSVLVRHGNTAEAPGEGSEASHAECDANEAVTGGGYLVLSQAEPFQVSMNLPSALLGEGITAVIGPAPDGIEPIGWLVSIENESAEPMTFRSYVLCSSP